MAHTTVSSATRSASQRNQHDYRFFQFPLLNADGGDENELVPQPPQSPPPAAVQYWTSDSTRRLEYAAIDAASKGLKGFFVRLLPDCVLPSSTRRTRFHCDDAGSDAGSVRRYRLVLPEEKNKKVVDMRRRMSEQDEGSRRSGNEARQGLFRRWTTGLGFARAS